MSEIALQGNLSTFSIEDALNFINEKSQTGRLEIVHGDEHIVVYFEQGLVVGLNGLLDGSKIGTLLHRQSALSLAALDKIESTSGAEFIKAISSILNNDIKAVLQVCLDIQQTEEMVDIFTMKEGNFQFETSLDVQIPDILRLNISVPEFLENGVELRDKWLQIQSALSNNKLIPQIVDLEAIDIEPIRPSAESWLALAVLDGRRSISEIAKISPWGRYATLLGICEFLAAKLITLESKPLPSPENQAPEPPSEVAEDSGGFFKSLRGKGQIASQPIHSLTGFLADFAQRFLAAYLPAEEQPSSSAVLYSIWQEAAMHHPLSDLIRISGNSVNVSCLEKTVSTWSDEKTAKEVLENSKSALTELIQRLYDDAIERIGEKKALSIYTKVYASLANRTDLPVSQEEIQALGLEKQT